MRISGVLVDSGVDYLTATAKQRERREQFAAIGQALAISHYHDGFEARPVSFSGYSGLQVGHVYFGERDDSAILRLGSYVAQAHYKRVVECADNVTRIDLQATYKLEQDVKKCITGHFREMRRYASSFKKFPGVALFIGRDDSRTLYSGSRSSDRYGRCYDKGAESGLAWLQGCIRYETEFKGKRARGVASAVTQGHTCSLCFSRAASKLFIDRGASIKTLTASSSCFEIDISSKLWAPRTDVEEVLKWLRKSVSPSVRRLLSRDLQGQVLAALGISAETLKGSLLQSEMLALPTRPQEAEL